MHQGNLNLHHPIYDCSGFMDSFFMVGVASKGPEEVDYLSCLTSFIYPFKYMGWGLSVSDSVMEARC